MVDSSPMYGRAEAVVGTCLATLNARSRAFVATKVWTRGRQAGIDEMRRSLQLLGTPQLDLMQIHNLLDWRTHIDTLRAWKAEGLIRYVGVTHYTASAHAELAAVLRTTPVDFVQINYSLEEPESAREILPLAMDRGIAVIVNRPFGGGELVRRLRDQPIPAWAAELRLRALVSAAAQIRPGAPGGDDRHSGDRKSHTHGRRLCGWIWTGDRCRSPAPDRLRSTSDRS